MKVFAEIQRLHPDTKIIYVGQNAKSVSDSERFGVKNIEWVTTTSSQDELSKIYSRFDVFIHVPRLGETFGNVVAEAMMHGNAVASLKGSFVYPQAQAEVISDNQQCVRTRPQLVKLISLYITDSNFRSMKGRQNFYRSKDNFARTKVAEEHMDLFRRILEFK